MRSDFSLNNYFELSNYYMKSETKGGDDKRIIRVHHHREEMQVKLE